LARLLPIAERLKTDGHVVLAAVRDIVAAARVFGPRGIAFVQAPHLPQGIPLGHRATGYADILLTQGWSDTPTLWGQVQSWLNLYRLFAPDRLILDYSPTATLAARIAGIFAILVGNGFELPPLTDPLPAFPAFSWADPTRAADSERRALANANATLRAYGSSRLTALCELFSNNVCLLATVPQLDHYGARREGRYIGPLVGDFPNSLQFDWPEGEGPRVFACLQPNTSHVRVILSALVATPARVICVTRGFSKRQLEPFQTPFIRFTSETVNLGSLPHAALCITYGAEGTMMHFLRAGTRQLISPWHVEAFMAARRLVAAGWGLTLEGAPTMQIARGLIEELTSRPAFQVPCALSEDAATAAVVAAVVGSPATRSRADACESGLGLRRNTVGAA
jgi:UDP:flavonoid glycosyltransferase YjiC (YdhE family)